MYVKNIATGALTLVSTSDTGVKGSLRSWVPSMSADGTTVAFSSDTTTSEKGTPTGTPTSTSRTCGPAR